MKAGTAYLPPVLLFILFSRVKLETRATVAAAMGSSFALLHLLCMLLGHGQQVLWYGSLGLL